MSQVQASTIGSNGNKVYPHHVRPVFANRSQSARYNELKRTKTVVETEAPVEGTMRSYFIFNAVTNWLNTSGLTNLKVLQFPTYEAMCYEFVSTWEEVIEGEVVVGWKFRLGSETYELSKEEVCAILDFDLDGTIPEYSDHCVLSTWRIITGMFEYDTNCSYRAIDIPAVKYIHRFMAVNFNARKDKFSRVTMDDLNLLTGITTTSFKVDYFGLLTKRLRVWRNPNSRLKVIGGGTFITAIASVIGFEMDKSLGRINWIDQDALIRDRMIDGITFDWRTLKSLPKSGGGRLKKFIDVDFDAERASQIHPRPSIVTGLPAELNPYGEGPSSAAPANEVVIISDDDVTFENTPESCSSTATA